MRTLSWVGYILLLVAAFAIGMVGTVAAGRALLSSAATPIPALSPQPTQLPVGTPEGVSVPTVEC